MSGAGGAPSTPARAGPPSRAASPSRGPCLGNGLCWRSRSEAGDMPASGVARSGSSRLVARRVATSRTKPGIVSPCPPFVVIRSAFACHPERSEGFPMSYPRGRSSRLRHHTEQPCRACLPVGDARSGWTDATAMPRTWEIRRCAQDDMRERWSIADDSPLRPAAAHGRRRTNSAAPPAAGARSPSASSCGLGQGPPHHKEIDASTRPATTGSRPSVRGSYSPNSSVYVPAGSPSGRSITFRSATWSPGCQ